MSSDSNRILFENVSKRYARNLLFHKSLREEVARIFKPNSDSKKIKDDFYALRNISFIMQHGEAVGLYGPNGAGKSTILKLIAKVTYPSEGNLQINGKVAPLIEVGAGFHPDLTGRENIFINGTILGMSISEVREKLNAIIEFSGLNDFIDVPVKKYSSGMYLRLAFSVAMHSDAEIFLFDEILSVGDEDFQRKCHMKIEELRNNGKTLLVVSHDKQLLRETVDSILILRAGQIIDKEFLNR